MTNPIGYVPPAPVWPFAPLSPLQQQRTEQQRRAIFGDAPIIRPRNPQ